jgi:hypothetical protein
MIEVSMVHSLVFGYALLAFGAAFAASPSPAVRAEVDHLFAYLEQSGCDFFRNGDWHSAPEARGHLERKYNALAQNGQVATTEDFIKRGASQSSASGTAYLVRCSGRPTASSARWLTDELQRFRQTEGKK